MAVPTGSGTETLHSHLFSDVDATTKLIIGAQHHVYTVLSIIVWCQTLNSTTTSNLSVYLRGWDNHAGETGSITLFKSTVQANETFVWNDKFSFNGYEPTGVSGMLGAGDAAADAAYQIAIGAQGGSVVQYLEADPTHATDNYDITVTYLDQDWS